MRRSRKVQHAVNDVAAFGSKIQAEISLEPKLLHSEIFIMGFYVSRFYKFLQVIMNKAVLDTRADNCGYVRKH